MNNRLCEMFGIEAPIFAFSHCRDVVVEVSRAGGLGVLLGLVLWLGHRAVDGFPTMVGSPAGWLHAKLLLVALMLAQFIVCGRWLKGVEQGRALPSPRTLRLVNELPVLALLVVIWLVLAKPF